MSDELYIDGKTYISSKRASVLSGYAQDYIGQLARGGSIDARRVGGLWMLTLESLERYQKDAQEGKTARAERLSQDAVSARDNTQDSFVGLDGNNYISANRASVLSGYNQDYIGQMARMGVVPSRQIGNRWYVDRESLLRHKTKKDALLAVVQADSVGLARNMNQPEKVASEREAAPLLTYTTDERELLPSVHTEKGEVATVSAAASGGDNLKEQQDFGAPTHNIPMFRAENTLTIHRSFESINTSKNILILRPSYAIADPRVVGTWGKTLSLLTASALTIVIVVSLGFETMKSQAQYATATSTPQVRLTAFLGVALDPLFDTFEEWFVPEISYKRSSSQ